MSTAPETLWRRDRDTVRTACGVRLNPTHWASVSVHAFCRWVDDATLTTWCGLTASLEDGARQTTELVSCLACGQNSWDVLSGNLRSTTPSVRGTGEQGR